MQMCGSGATRTETRNWRPFWEPKDYQPKCINCESLAGYQRNLLSKCIYLALHETKVHGLCHCTP